MRVKTPVLDSGPLSRLRRALQDLDLMYIWSALLGLALAGALVEAGIMLANRPRPF